MAVTAGLRVHEARTARSLTLGQVAERAGVSRATVHSLEGGRPASLETYARIATALSLRPELVLDDGRGRPTQRRDEDAVHAAMGEIEARHLRALGRRVAIDEPYQHYQFAGRADIVAWDVDQRALLHIENRTRFPNMQEAAGSFNAKRAYLAGVLAERLGIRGGWTSVTHTMVVLWSSETLHSLRLRRSTFTALCPDPLDALDAWWSDERPPSGDHVTLAVFDPAPDLGRRRRYVGLDALDGIDPRYRGYADAARRLG